jgi:hypothetical protein
MRRFEISAPLRMGSKQCKIDFILEDCYSVGILGKPQLHLKIDLISIRKI